MPNQRLIGWLNCVLDAQQVYVWGRYIDGWSNINIEILFMGTKKSGDVVSSQQNGGECW
jgi:hypothetical protein